MPGDRIYRGWDVLGRAGRNLKRTIADIGKSAEARQAESLATKVMAKVAELDLAISNPSGEVR